MIEPDANTGTTTSGKSQRLQELTDKALGFANAADALAKRLVGKVRTSALVGFVSAAWLTYACVATFDLGLTGSVLVLLSLCVVPMVLWKSYATLRDIVGLPERLNHQRTALLAKLNQGQAYYNSLSEPGRQSNPYASDSGNKRPTLRQMWRTGKWMLDAKSLGDDAQVLVSEVGAALILTNPIFAIVLTIATALVGIMTVVAVLTALAHLF